MTALLSVYHWGLSTVCSEDFHLSVKIRIKQPFVKTHFGNFAKFAKISRVRNFAVLQWLTCASDGITRDSWRKTWCTLTRETAHLVCAVRIARTWPWAIAFVDILAYWRGSVCHTAGETLDCALADQSKASIARECDYVAVGEAVWGGRALAVVWGLWVCALIHCMEKRGLTCQRREKNCTDWNKKCVSISRFYLRKILLLNVRRQKISRAIPILPLVFLVAFRSTFR